MFCICETDFDVFTIFSKFSNFKKMYVHGNTYANGKLKPFSNKKIFN